MFTFKIDTENFTIEINQARLMDLTCEVGEYLILNNIVNPATGDIVNLRLMIVPEGGFKNWAL